MQAIESSRVVENKERLAPKVEQLRGSQPSGSGGKEQSSKYIKESWYEMTMQGAQEKEAFRSMIKEKSLMMGPSEMARIVFASEGATNHVYWKATMVVDLTTKTEPPPGGRTTFLAKREC
jgi:hypothetical protein